MRLFMPSRFAPWVSLAVIALIAALSDGSAAPAAVLTWDGNGATAPNPNGGTGTWNTNSTANWWNGSTNVVWPALGGTDDDALFANSAGTVTISGGVTANDLTFNTTGYSITASTLTLNGTTPTITTAPGVDAAISSAVAGTAGLTKAGAGKLTLTGTAPLGYTGATAVNAGTLKLNLTAVGGLTAIGYSSAVNIANSATLELNGSSAASADNAYFNNAALAFTGSGTITKTGTGYLGMILATGVKDFTGLIDIQQGILGNNGSGWAAGAGAMDLNIASGAIFDMRTGNVKVDGLTGSGSITSSHNQGLNLSVGNNNGTATYSGTINNGSFVPLAGGVNGGVISLTKVGTGTQTLTGVNTYTGATTVNGGTLEIGTGGVINTNSNLIVGGGPAAGTLKVSGGSVATNLSNVFALTIGNGSAGALEISAGNLTINGAGSGMVLGNAAASPATWTQTGGTVNYSGNAGFFIANIAGGATTMTISGGSLTQTQGVMYFGVRDTASMTISGAGAVSVPTFQFGFGGGTAATRTLYLDGGSLQANAVTHAQGTSDFNFNGGALIAGANTATFMQGLTRANVRNGGAIINTQANSITIAQALLHSNLGGDAAIDGGVTKLGSGTLTLTGANTYTGTTTVNAGTLTLSGTAPLGYTGATAINAGTLRVSIGNVASGWSSAVNVGAAGTLDLNSTGGTSADSTFFNSGSLAFIGSGTIIKTGAGYLGMILATGVKDFTGLIDIQQGILGNNGAGWASGAGAMDLNIASGAIFDMRTGNVKVDGLTGSGSITSSHNQAVNLSVGNNNGTATYHGTINNGSVVPLGGAFNAGVVSLTKVGTGTQTLTGANTYGGATLVSSGTLRIDGTHSGNGAYTVAANGTLLVNGAKTGSGTVTVNGTLGGAGNISGTTTITSGGILSPGNSPGVLTFATLNLADGAVVNFEGGDRIDTTNLTIVDDWTLNIFGSPSNWSAGGYTVLFTYVNLPTLTGNWNDPMFGGNLASILAYLGLVENDLSIVNIDGEIRLIGMYAVPEPSSLLLVGIAGIGMIGVAARRRRRLKNATYTR